MSSWPRLTRTTFRRRLSAHRLLRLTQYRRASTDDLPNLYTTLKKYKNNPVLRVWCVMACHNRRSKTLNCLRSVLAQHARDVELGILLVDDGSIDGTSDAVRSCYPQVQIVPGTGSLYWGGAMRLGISSALKHRPDFIWMVNDDVEFESDALDRQLSVARSSPGTWVAGATRQPASSQTTYSGYVRSGRLRPRIRMVEPSDGTQVIDFGPANSLLLPASDYAALGGIDTRFPHGYGDLDFTRRASKARRQLILAPRHVGTCAANPLPLWPDASAPLVDRIRDLHSIRNRPPRQAAWYISRHYGIQGIPLFFRPYVVILWSWARSLTRVSDQSRSTVSTSSPATASTSSDTEPASCHRHNVQEK